MSTNAFKGIISVLSILTDAGFKIEDKESNLEMYINGPEDKNTPRSVSYHDGLIYLEMLYTDTLTIVLDGVCKSIKFSPNQLLLKVITPPFYTKGFEMKEIDDKQVHTFKKNMESIKCRVAESLPCKYPC